MSPKAALRGRGAPPGAGASQRGCGASPDTASERRAVPASETGAPETPAADPLAERGEEAGPGTADASAPRAAAATCMAAGNRAAREVRAVWARPFIEKNFVWLEEDLMKSISRFEGKQIRSLFFEVFLTQHLPLSPVRTNGHERSAW